MGEILTEFKASIVRGFRREKSERENLIEAAGVVFFIIIMLVGLFSMVTAPVTGDGEITFSTNDPIFEEVVLQQMDLPEGSLINSTGSGFNVTIKGRFTAPAFVFSALTGR